MIRSLTKNYPERIWKKAALVWFKVPSRYLPGGTERNNEKLSQGCRYPSCSIKWVTRGRRNAGLWGKIYINERRKYEPSFTGVFAISLVQRSPTACLYVCDQETPQREAKGPSWTISACECEFAIACSVLVCRPYHTGLTKLIKHAYVRLQVLTAASMERVFWDVASCSLVATHWRFCAAYCLQC
jgi:hypothetical protein